MKHILMVDDVATNLKCAGEVLKDKYELSKDTQKDMIGNDRKERRNGEEANVKSVTSTQKQNLRVFCVDDSPSALASLKYALS